MNRVNVRPYTEEFSLVDEYDLLFGIQSILCYQDYHVAHLLLLILYEWGAHIRPNRYLGSMMGFAEKLHHFLYKQGSRWELHHSITADAVLLFCIQEAFPQFIQTEDMTWVDSSGMDSLISATNGESICSIN